MRLGLILLALAIPALLLLGPALPLEKVPTYTPHEDPTAAPTRFDSPFLLLYYSDVIDLAAIGRWDEIASKLLELKGANIPADLRYIAERFNQLLSTLGLKLQRLAKTLDRAGLLLDQKRLDEAAQELESAHALAEETEDTLFELEEAADTLSRRLGAATAPAGSFLEKAYAEFKGSLELLERLYERYRRLLETLKEELERETSNLIPTELTLELDRETAFPGERLTISGRLSTAQEGLAGRVLTVGLDGQTIGRVTTAQEGFYDFSFSLPFKYKPQLPIVVTYIPQGPDAGKFRASRVSGVIYVEFFPTPVSLEAPATLYPGLEADIRVQIGTRGPRRLNLLLDDRILARADVRQELKLKMTVPPEIPSGRHRLIARVQPQGPFAGGQAVKEVQVVRVYPQVVIGVKPLALLPGKLSVNGKIASKLGPLEGARVLLTLGKSKAEFMTSPEGRFEGDLKLSWDLSMVGFQDLRVKVLPREPWNASADRTVRIFVVNSINLGLMALAILSLGLFLRPLPRRRQPAGYPEPAPTAISTYPVLEPAHAAEGGLGRIREALYRAISAIERALGILIRPSTTLREFLNQVTPKQAFLAGIFRELVSIAERLLYSREADEKDIERVEKLSHDVEKAVRT